MSLLASLTLTLTLFAFLFFGVCTLLAGVDCQVTVVNHCCAPENSDFFLYVNGMCSTRLLALDTGRVLADMFHRDITVVHNPTDSVMVDLFEV